MNRRTVIIGAGGQLGSDLVDVWRQRNWPLYPLTHRQIEITDEKSVSRTLNRIRPELVINTAAFHDLNECEKRPSEALAVNCLGVKHLADWCAKQQVTFVHISTDYVFGSNLQRRRPYRETDAPGPQNVYGVSKAAGEWLIALRLKKFFLVRTSGLYGLKGSRTKGGNFVDKRIEQAGNGETIKMVDDQILSPTYTLNLAENLERLLKTEHFGCYHMVSHGACSWYEFTKEILRLTGQPTKLIRVKTDDHKAGVIRPRYSVLKNQGLQKIGLDRMNHWRKNLLLYLKAKGFLKTIKKPVENRRENEGSGKRASAQTKTSSIGKTVK